MTLHRSRDARTAIVLAHGVMSHAAWFDPLADELVARGITVAAVDRRGSGNASIEGRDDRDAWVGDLVTTVRSLRADHDRVALVGWCWGARTAILAATPSEASHLILAAPGIAMTAVVKQRAAELASLPGDDVALPFEADAFSDDPRVVAFIRGDARAWRSQPRSFLAPSRAVLDDARAILPTLPMPVTTLLARNDRIVDNDGVRALVRDAELLDGGHAVVLESPALVADRIVAATT